MKYTSSTIGSESSTCTHNFFLKFVIQFPLGWKVEGQCKKPSSVYIIIIILQISCFCEHIHTKVMVTFANMGLLALFAYFYLQQEKLYWAALLGN